MSVEKVFMILIIALIVFLVWVFFYVYFPLRKEYEKYDNQGLIKKD